MRVTFSSDAHIELFPTRTADILPEYLCFGAGFIAVYELLFANAFNFFQICRYFLGDIVLCKRKLFSRDADFAEVFRGG